MQNHHNTSKPAKPKRLIGVIGPHRCGTSAIARALRVFGVELGNSLMPADGYNERGYWEDTDIYKFNQDLMFHIGREWDSLDLISEAEIASLLAGEWFDKACDLLRRKLENCELLGVKDPRLSILLPFWLPVFRNCHVDPAFVIAVRNPAAAVSSLVVRNQMSELKACWLWIIHTLAALKHTEGFPRALVGYEVLLTDPEATLIRAGKSLGLSINNHQMFEYRQSFLESGLNHFTASNAEIEMRLRLTVPLAFDIYSSALSYIKELGVPKEVWSGLLRWNRSLADSAALLSAFAVLERDNRNFGQMASRLSELEGENKQLVEGIVEHEKGSLALRASIWAKEARLAEIEAQLTNSIAEALRIQKVGDESISALSADVLRLKHELDLAMSRNQELNEKSAQAQAELDQALRRQCQFETETAQQYTAQQAQIAALAEENAAQKTALDSLELWQRSWLRRAFRRWHRYESRRRMGFLRRLERSLRRRRKAIFGITSHDKHPPTGTIPLG